MLFSYTNTEKRDFMRKSGIFLAISSLPGSFGIGTLGQGAFDFINFLEKSGQKLWQVLPIGPTAYGDSPYQSPSAFAGNPYFIDLGLLMKKGLLSWDESNVGWENDSVNYGDLYERRFDLLRTAFSRFKNQIPRDYDDFKKQQDFWLSDYALFMTLKEKNHGAAWQTWPNEERNYIRMDKEAMKRVYKEQLEFWCFIQYEFFSQWKEMKRYAYEKGIGIIGDMPIYTASDSADVWANPELFLTDENFNPLVVAGCPPDSFAKTGQLWGNPIYNWEEMRRREYHWWIKRFSNALLLFDYIRLDHFRGFESFYAVPYGDCTAEHGIALRNRW